MAYSFDCIAPLYDLFMPRQRPDRFLSLLGAGPEDTILEVGAGTGRIARFYAPSARRCVLVDPSTRMLRRAQRRVPRACHVVGHAERLDLPDASFSKIVCYDSVHHWSDQSGGLAEVRRVLEPGGRCVLVEVDPRTSWGRKVARVESWMGMGSRFHPPDALARLAETAGLRQVTHSDLGNGNTYALVGTR